jgi:hypothetical protein
MVSAEWLKFKISVEGKVIVADDRMKGVEGEIRDARDDVHDVSNNLKAQIIDDQLDHINRSPSLQLCSTFLGSDFLQETTLEIDFYDGFRHQIHPPIISSHAGLITTVQLNGLCKGEHSINGNLLTPSCGYVENVCYS